MKNEVMSSPSETGSRREIEKPVGVYVITVFDFFVVGVTPMVAIFMVKDNPDVVIPFLSFVLPLPNMVACIWAMTGDNTGRWLLLGLVTASSILIITSAIRNLVSGAMAGTDAITAVGAILRGVFWIIINWWYFNRKGTRAYYNRDKAPRV